MGNMLNVLDSGGHSGDLDAHTVRAPIVGTRRGSLPALHCSCILSSTYMLCLRATAASSCTRPHRLPPPQTPQDAGNSYSERQRAWKRAVRRGAGADSEVRALLLDSSASPSPSPESLATPGRDLGHLRARNRHQPACISLPGGPRGRESRYAYTTPTTRLYKTEKVRTFARTFYPAPAAGLAAPEQSPSPGLQLPARALP